MLCKLGRSPVAKWKQIVTIFIPRMAIRSFLTAEFLGELFLQTLIMLPLKLYLLNQHNHSQCGWKSYHSPSK